MFTISFYVFSAFIAYIDYKMFRIPNIMTATLAIFLLIFGILEQTISKSSFVIPILVLLFFIGVMLINRQMILGGGDIKYYMVIGLYLDIFLFPLFLIVAGLLQTGALLYRQKVQKRKVVAMGPVIFLAVILTEIINATGVYPYVTKIG